MSEMFRRVQKTAACKGEIGETGANHLFRDHWLRIGWGFGMPRVARIVVAGQPHHVVGRGNSRQDVLFVDDDRRAYLEFLREHCERFGFNVLCYCLKK